MLLHLGKLPYFVTIASAMLLHAPSLAADASDWDGDSRAGIRLIAGNATTETSGARLRAGLEIRLGQGWKTYWRYPGDSGVPPQFDFAASDNVKSVTVAWPAPHRMPDSEGVTIGYTGGVVFPLRIEPSDPGKPVTLRLKFDYAICEKLCVPAQGQAELQVTGRGDAQQAAIAAADARVPQPRALGADAAFAVKALRRDDSVKPARMLVDVAAPQGATVELFAEGPSSDWALPVPEAVAGAPAGMQRFAFALDGLPPGTAGTGAEIKLTAATAKDAIETTFRLD